MASEPLERPDEAAALTTARLTNKKVRITEMTSETSEFWALPDGRVEAEVHLGPVRLQNKTTGKWRPVDFTLAPQADGSVAAKAHPAGLRLSGAAGVGEHDLVTVGNGEESVSLGWSGRLPAPTLSGSRATYNEVRPGVDLVVEATRTGFEQFVIVKERSAVAQVRNLAVPLRGKGLTVIDDKRGGFELRDAAGKVIGVSPEPMMWDSRVHPESGERIRQVRVDKTVTKGRTGRVAVTLTPNERWLTDPATAFPVTIDPTVTLKPSYDAFVESGITSDQSAATELKLGTFDGGTTKARTFMSFWNMDWLHGKQVQSAKLYLWSHHSWSCTARQWEAWQTSYVGSTARWTNQPTWRKLVGTSTQTKGYNASCNEGWVDLPVTTSFADLANDLVSGTVNIGLRATSETDNLGWKRFHSMEGANDPYVTLTYQTLPTVTARATVPSAACGANSGASVPYLNTTTPQLRAQITDGEGSPVRGEFEWWTPSAPAPIGSTVIGPDASGSWLTAGVPAGALANGNQYSWRVRGSDSTSTGAWTPWCYFTIDTTAPVAMPSVSSTTYPAGQWTEKAGTAGTFTFGAAGVTDVAAYEYGLNVNPPNQSVNAPSLGANATVSITPTQDGPHTLYVRSRDRAGNQSTIQTYTFNVGLGAVTSPKEGDITAAKVALTGMGQVTATGITYQWRRGDADTWLNLPASHVTVAADGAGVTWPVATSGSGAFPRLNWDVEATLTATDPYSIPRDGPLQLRAVLTGGAGGTSSTVRITFDRNLASADTAQMGPGSVNLITGNYQIPQTDVAISGLGISRTVNSRQPLGLDPLFGPGWVSGLVVQDAEAPYTRLTTYGSLVQVKLPDDSTIGFTKVDSTGVNYEAQAGAESYKLTFASGTSTFTLADGAGNVVTFTRTSTDPANVYTPTAATAPGSGNTATYSWEKATVGANEIMRPTRMLAPVPTGVTCTTLVKGCRALTFTYATATTATGLTDGTWGDYTGRVKQISYTAWDPDLTTPAMRTVVVARYTYDSTGRLRTYSDPRLDYTSGGPQQLRTVYSYNGNGVIVSLTPPAQQPWQFSYTTLPSDPGIGRLYKVTRSALTAGTAVETVVYRVPTSGSGAPYDLSAGQTARWGQTEPPTDATAVFPPTQVPAGDPATGTMPSSYERATVTYLDANARAVNGARPGGNITTAWYDGYGNSVGELTAGNRKRALDASGSDSVTLEAQLAAKLSSTTVYSAGGQQVVETFGPEHDVTLASGTVVRGRSHTRYTYDEGAPQAGGPFDLATTVRVSVSHVVVGQTVDEDVRSTTTQYDWSLKQPTETTVDPGGLDLVTRTEYDSAGRVTLNTTPGGGGGDTTPATRVTVYYTAAANPTHPECGARAEWAGQLCRTQAGGQPEVGQPLAAEMSTYDLYGQVKAKIEKAGAVELRRTEINYDAVGREYESTVSAPGQGEPLEKRRNVYDAASGNLLRTQSINGVDATTAEIVRVYDGLGRQTSYTDADGTVTTTTYNLLSQPVTVNDGKGSRTLAYEGGTERRALPTQVVDTQAGTVTGQYDVDERLTSEVWPNGVSVTSTYDETGATTGVTYVKPGCGQTDCTVYSETVAANVHGEQRSRQSTLSAQLMDYDNAGRLLRVRDTVGGQCVTRAYTLDPAGNRSAVDSYAPGAGGVCQTSTTATGKVWEYDSADRVTGYTHDALGRATLTPAVDVPTGGVNSQMTYYVNDMVRSITQGTRVSTYTMDVLSKRARSWTDSGSGAVVTRRNHYGDDGDNPSWTEEGGIAFTRSITGLSRMIGVFGNIAGLNWVITNLHGDHVAGMAESLPGLTYTSEQTELGQFRSSADIGSRRYGWLGSEQRASDTPNGMVLMGSRLYNPSTGRFLSVDPVYGGNANAYEYCNADPVNCADVSGEISCFRYGSKKTYRNWWGMPYRWEWKFRCNLTHGEAIGIAKSGSAVGIYQALKQVGIAVVRRWIVAVVATLLVDWLYSWKCTSNRGFWFTGVYGFTLKWMVPYAGINNFGCR
ncbi:DNRLRE domain-containing protein [Micromonospora matsumotoense]|uniref:DNRLRE domain-containing protein n=1 Tax=Micromonospora matsumotoense TaxID=121616 RepID=UPI003441A74A